MGTLSQWEKVAELALFWGVLTPLAPVRRMLPSLFGSPSRVQLLDHVGTLFAGLVFGMMFFFEWQVVHGKLAIIFWTAAVVGFISSLAHRKPVKTAQPDAN